MYFKYKSLTRISGEPKFVILYNLLLELKADAVLISSALGRDVHGVIGMILSAPKHDTRTPLQPLIIPVHPGPIQVAQGAT